MLGPSRSLYNRVVRLSVSIRAGRRDLKLGVQVPFSHMKDFEDKMKGDERFTTLEGRQIVAIVSFVINALCCASEETEEEVCSPLAWIDVAHLPFQPIRARNARARLLPPSIGQSSNLARQLRHLYITSALPPSLRTSVFSVCDFSRSECHVDSYHGFEEPLQ
ncbi:hypothetical protein J6590_022872 [Homalodisca vitripennis]|nr:hypothetical protein J6590_022872 [Homalodisca vitripennis]